MPGGGVVNVGGADYIRLSSGALMPMAGMVGTGLQGRIAGVKSFEANFNAGSDINHARIFGRLNCNNGIDLYTPDNVLASESFNSPNEEIIGADMNLVGGAAGSILYLAPADGITMLHLAFEGSGTYTQAAGATVTGLEMVVVIWDEPVSAVILDFGDSETSGGGSNQRVRKASFRGYLAS